jgi:threonylcarbamoyladenosine tRNA methylthiotransferase MtaB
VFGAVSKAKEIAALGTKEIVLTGINLGDFKNGEEVFFDLIKALDEVEGIERYRISSIEPNLLTDEIIDWVSISKKFMPHFHIPLQSGSDKILKLMRRRYLSNLYKSRIEKIKSVMPHACIGADVIVGFPSETEDDFKTTFDFIHSLPISYLHVFTYSERLNTLAITLPNAVPMHIRKQRNQTLRNLSSKLMHHFRHQFENTTRKVLFESENKNGMMEGYSDNYLRISLPFDENKINQIVAIKIQEQQLSSVQNEVIA